MKVQEEGQYMIPARYRRMENMHIVFWLVKDISWCMIWKELGIAMFIPTLSIAIIIAWREFFGFDEAVVWRDFTGKHMALIPFLIGAIILLLYYTIQRPRDLKSKQPVTL